MTDLTPYYRIARDVGIPGRLLLAVADADRRADPLPPLEVRQSSVCY